TIRPCSTACCSPSRPWRETPRAGRGDGSNGNKMKTGPGPLQCGPGPAQLVEKPLSRRIRPSIGGGARGGGSPPRVGSNALNALQSKAFSERSEDFSAVERRESNGIFSGHCPGGG